MAWEEKLLKMELVLVMLQRNSERHVKCFCNLSQVVLFVFLVPCTCLPPRFPSTLLYRDRNLRYVLLVFNSLKSRRCLFDSRQQLTAEELERIEEACDMALELNQSKHRIYEYVESRMSFIAPNLSIIVGASTAAKIMGETPEMLAVDLRV